MGRQTGLNLVKRKGSSNWHIEGTLFGRRVRKSTGSASREEAILILNEVVSQIKQEHLFGVREVTPDFNTLAVKHLKESTKSSIKEDARHIRDMAPYIGELPMTEIYRGYDGRGKPTPFERFVLDQARKKLSVSTINYAIRVLNIIGNRGAKEWRNSEGRPMIPYWTSVPQLNEEKGKAFGFKPKKPPYTLSWEEQDALFEALPEYLREACLFKVNTGCREMEVCRLRWEWLSESSGIWYFDLPGELVKNRIRRVVVLNRIAKQVIDRHRGDHTEFVFVNRGKPLDRINNSTFKRVRKRVAEKFPGLLNAGVHSLKHTYGARLRAAGVPEEDRCFLTGHKGRMSMATYYTVPELSQMLEYSNRVCKRQNNLILLGRRAS